MKRWHDMAFGPTLQADGVVFRLWAPSARQVELVLGAAAPRAMQAEPSGWYTLLDGSAKAGSRYRFRIDGELLVPDPASRHQPDGVHGASAVVDARAFDWTDEAWRGRPWTETVLYELHVGSFTDAGSFAGVERRLAGLAELGVTAVELMPLAEFAGQRGWGYDGVLAFAPASAYGRPEDLKHLVQAAHARGLMVFLDVVYNHFGPDGNYLHAYAASFFTDRHHTAWGLANNFDAAGSEVVRRFFIENALYWLEEYHFDGLRLDAVHAIHDDSPRHFLVELAERVRAALPHRHVHLVLENDANQARYLAPALYDAQWNDDLHHALHVLCSGEVSGYYRDYRQCPIRWLGRTLTEGFAYQGEASEHRGGEPRGEPSGHLPATRFVGFLQNHDQIGNRALGERLTQQAPPEAVAAALAVLLLAPSIPLLFMGEEWGCEQPFLYFCDFHDELAEVVREGRRREFADFPPFADARARRRIPDPNAEATFRRSRLDWAAIEQPGHRDRLAMVRRLLAVRRAEIVPRLTNLGAESGYHVEAPTGLEAWWRLGDGARLLLRANLGATPARVARPAAGRLLYRWPEGEAGDLAPPWTVTWWLC
jgi:malto-oligosyltrehalose trehalohydrolase